MTPGEAIQTIEGATKPSEIFGASYDKDYYLLLRKLIHPDRFPDEGMKERAEKAYQKLSEFAGKMTKPDEVVVGEYTVREIVYTGSVATLYRASNPAGECLLKVANTPKENDLLRAEEGILTELYESDDVDHRDAYLPKLLSSLEVNGKRAHGIKNVVGGTTMLDIALALGGSVPFVHLVWMANRALAFLDFCYRNDVVWGGALPNHLIYTVADHGMVAVDFTNSVTPGKKLRYVSPTWETFYPKEAKRGFTKHTTDIYMLAKSIVWASGAGTTPPEFRDLLTWAMGDSPSSRPDVWTFHQKWKEAAEKVYGERKFIPLTLPAN